MKAWLARLFKRTARKIAPPRYTDENVRVVRAPYGGWYTSYLSAFDEPIATWSPSIQEALGKKQWIIENLNN